MSQVTFYNVSEAGQTLINDLGSSTDGNVLFDHNQNSIYWNVGGTIYNTGLGGVYTTTGTYSSFMVYVPGVTSYYAGLTIRVRFHTHATSSSTLSINGLAALPIKRCLSIYNQSVVALGSYTIYTNSVVTLTYSGSTTNGWIIQDRPQPVGYDLYGNVSFNKVSGYGETIRTSLPDYNATSDSYTWYSLFGQGAIPTPDLVDYYGGDFTFWLEDDNADYDISTAKVLTVAVSPYYLYYHANGQQASSTPSDISAVQVVDCYKNSAGGWTGYFTAPPSGTSSTRGISLNQFKIQLGVTYNTVEVSAFSSGTGAFTATSTAYDSAYMTSYDYDDYYGTSNVNLEKYIWVLGYRNYWC